MRSVLAAIVLISLSVSAAAQPARRKTLQQRVGELETKLQEAQKTAADVPALLKSVQDLQQQLAAVKKQLARGKGVERAFKALRSELDGLGDRLGALQMRMVALGLQAADRGRRTGYHEGFFLRSGDDKFKVKLNGFAQLRYRGELYSDRRNYAGSALGEHRSAFDMPFARLVLSGHVLDQRVRYYIGADFAAPAGPAPLLDAFGEFAFHRMVKVRAGLFRVPFGRQFNLDLPSLQFGERNGVTLNFYPGRDLGAMAHGELVASSRFGHLSYQLGIFNGASPERLDDTNTDFLYVARLLYEPLGRLPTTEGDRARVRLPRVALGASFFWNLASSDAAERAGETDPTKVQKLRDQDRDGEVDNVSVVSVAGELAAHWRGLSLQGEVFYRREDPGAVADERTYWGTYGQLGSYHRLCIGLEIVARYGFWQVQRYGEDGSTVAPAKVHEVAAAINGWLWEERIRLQAQYAHRWMRGLGDLNGNAAAEDKLGLHMLTVFAQIAF